MEFETQDFLGGPWVSSRYENSLDWTLFIFFWKNITEKENDVL